MKTEEEIAYNQGHAAAWQAILSQAQKHLEPSPGRSLESYIAERSAAIQALRDLCHDVGDNDWDDDLHLADIINKHLARHLVE